MRGRIAPNAWSLPEETFPVEVSCARHAGAFATDIYRHIPIVVTSAPVARCVAVRSALRGDEPHGCLHRCNHKTTVVATAARPERSACVTAWAPPRRCIMAYPAYYPNLQVRLSAPPAPRLQRIITRAAGHAATTAERCRRGAIGQAARASRVWGGLTPLPACPHGGFACARALVCVRVWVPACVRACACVCACLCAHACVRACACACTCASVRVRLCVCVSTLLCVCSCQHECVRVHTHTPTSSNACTCGRTLPHPHWDWAHPLPDLHRDWATHTVGRGSQGEKEEKSTMTAFQGAQPLHDEGVGAREPAA